MVALEKLIRLTHGIGKSPGPLVTLLLLCAAVLMMGTAAWAAGTAPVAANDNYAVNKDTILQVAAPGVLGNDTDAESDALTAKLIQTVAHGTLRLFSDGRFNYVPATGWTGTVTFTYQAYDGTSYSPTATVTLHVAELPQPPVAVADAYSTDEDTLLSVPAPGVLGNDYDPNGDPITPTLIAGTANGTLTFNADGSFDYDPDANWNGIDTFTYQLSDGSFTSDVVTVSITVNSVNDAPIAQDGSASVAEDSALSLPSGLLLASLVQDVDAVELGQTFELEVLSGPSHGTLDYNPVLELFTYTPEADWNGTETITYRVSDGELYSNEATLTITVTPLPDAPTAVDDAYSTDEDTSLLIAAPGVLDNDYDVDNTVGIPQGDVLTAVLVDDPANGSLVLNSDGSFTYLPNADFTGTDSFTYQANDGALNSAVATVTITVNPVNDAPTAVDGYTGTDEDTLLSIAAAEGIVPILTDDVDGDELIIELVDDVTNGTLTLNADGSLEYLPNPDWFGTDSFTYRAFDGELYSSTATVTIFVYPVNDAPAATDDAYSTDEDTLLVVDAPGVLANDSDVDGDALLPVVVDDPANGTLTLFSDGSFEYLPDADWNGVDTFTYFANDGELDSALATVTITVNPSDDAPVAADDAYSTDEDVALTIDAPGVLGNDSDVDNTVGESQDQELAAVLVDGPANGALTLNADGSFTYTPNENWNGTDSFTYLANDGTLDSNVATVTITVNPVNDAPVAEDFTDHVSEDSMLDIWAFEGQIQGLTSDIDSTTLTCVLVDGPAHGTLVLNADGSFSYTPEADWNGTDSFTWQAFDGELYSNVATDTIEVAPVPDAPVAADDAYTTDEDVALTIDAPGVLANDSDVDNTVGIPQGDVLAAVLVDGPANGALTLNADGSFTYTPNADWSGADSFTYVANDGTFDSTVATVTITVNPVNDAPVAEDFDDVIDEDTVLDMPAEFGQIAELTTDVDSSTLTCVLVDGPAHGTLVLNADGSFSYTPEADWNGTDSFTWQAFDGELYSNVATNTIEVVPMPDAPVAADDAYSTDEDVALTIDAPGVLENDSDVDNTIGVPQGDVLAAVLVGGPANGALTLNADGSFTYTPNENWNGTDSFTYLANDGTFDSTVATVTITVNPVNDAPVAQDFTDVIAEDEVLDMPAEFGQIAELTTDIDSSTLTCVLVDGPAHGTLVLNDDGSFTYTPDADWNGMDSFSWQAFDGELYSNVATNTIEVTPVNDAPTAVDDAYSTDEDVALTIDAPGVLENDSDVDNTIGVPQGDVLAAVLVDGPANGALTLNADGSFTYTPNENWNGTDSFTYLANDGQVDSLAPATVTITVNPVNDAPVAEDITDHVSEDSVLDVLAEFGQIQLLTSDIDSTTLTCVLVDGPAHGTLVLNADGSFTYTPEADWNGTDSFTWQAFDGELYSNVATDTIAVTPVNDAPTAVDDAYTTDEDVALTIAAPGVLENDYDVDNTIGVPQGDVLAAVLVDGPANGALTLNADGSFTYTPNENWNGTDSFTYLANDGTFDSNVATVTITVNPVNDAPHNVRITYPYNGDTFDGPADITIQAEAEDIDSAVKKIEFFQNGIKLGSDTSAPFNVTWNGVLPGTYDLTVIAYDAQGAPAGSDTVTITVTSHPTVSITNPLDGTVLPSGSSILVTASTGTSVSTIADVIFYLNGEELGDDTTNPFAVSWDDIPAGTYTLIAEAWDNYGDRAISDPVTVYVYDLAPQPDLLIGNASDTDLLGDNIYNVLDGQTASQTTPVDTAAVYTLQLQNDDPHFADGALITGDAGPEGWLVKYFAGDDDITEYVTGAGWSVNDLASAGQVDFRVEVTPTNALRGGDTLQITVGAVSQTGSTKTDLVAAETTLAALTSVSLTADPATGEVGQPTTFTGNAVGGGSVQYLFKVGKKVDNTWQWTVQDYSPATTFTWTPSEAGTYTVAVLVREAGNTSPYQAYKSMYYKVIPAPLTKVTLTTSVLSPKSTGVPVTLTAQAEGGVAEYKFFVLKKLEGGVYQWIQLQGVYNTNNVVTWTPNEAGTYVFVAYARAVGRTSTLDAYDSKNFNVTSPY